MTPARISAILRNRQIVFWLCGALICVIFWTALRALITLSIGDERYSYILAIPFLSAGLFYLETRHGLKETGYNLRTGAPVTLGGLGLFMVFKTWSGNLSIAIAGFVLVWIGLFISCYGTTAFRSARFPLLMLFLIVPIPDFILDKMVAALQAGSADVSYGLFHLAGVPVFRHGAILSVPGVDVEIAPQCSGIRSTMALFVSSVVLGEVLLTSGWGKFLLVLFVGPIGILRNAIRIVTVTLLGAYVNKDFLFGNVHHRGGPVFAVIGFALLIPIVSLLRSCERRMSSRRGLFPRTGPVRGGEAGFVE